MGKRIMPNLTLTNDQENASNEFLDFLIDDTQKYFIIHGSAGSGKSFLIKYLLQTYEAKYKAYNLLLQRDSRRQFTVHLTATTNKAATVLEDFLDGQEVVTLHSLLGLRVVNNLSSGKTTIKRNNASKDLSNCIIFIDEGSFIDEATYSELDNATHKCKIVVIGDQYQLAPVGQTKSIMESIDCKKVVLTEVIRNSGDIAKAGQQFKETVKTGIFKPIEFNDSDLIQVDGATFKQLIEDAYTSPNWHPNASKVVGWTNAKVQAYNAHIREINALADRFQKGETVVTNNTILNRNIRCPVDSQVVITDILEEATIHGIQGNFVEVANKHTAFLPHDFHEVKALLKKLAKDKDWPSYFNIKDTWLDLRSVYASSVHKAQGSTYETVFIDLNDIGSNWIPSDVARLLYVAISRASKQVVCYGQLPKKYCGE